MLLTGRVLRTLFCTFLYFFGAFPLVFFFSLPSQAQDLSTSAPSTALPVDPDTCPAGCVKAPPSDPSLWSKSLGLGASVTDGNSNTTEVNFSGAASRDFENNIWDFVLNYSYGESDNEESDDRQLTRNQVNTRASYKRLLSEKIFTGLGARFVYDEIADIDYRYFINPHVGAFTMKKDDLKLSFETGPSYIIEKVGNVEDDYLAPRFANHFEWKLNGQGKVFQNFEILFDVTSSDNYIINAEVGIESALTSLLSLVFVARDAYDNEPAEGRIRNDIALISSIKVNL